MYDYEDPERKPSQDQTAQVGVPGKTSLVQRRYAVQRHTDAPAPVYGHLAPVPGTSMPLLAFDAHALHLAPVQREAEASSLGFLGDDPAAVHAHAAAGIAGPASPLPHGEQIQRAFGPDHDLSAVRAHVGGPAATAAAGMGATAYATGNDIAFASAPDLHTAAHEAAHIVQQRAGVHLKGGVGQAGDPYEQHADAVADAVVRGDSAAQLLAAGPSATGSGGSIQRAVQRFGSWEHKTAGDAGSGGATYDRQGLSLSHGDLVMLRGDYFTEEQLTQFWNIRSPWPGHVPGTQDEVIYAIRHANPTDPRFAQGGPWHKLTFSSTVKDAVDSRYLTLATDNANHFVDPGRGGGGAGGFAAGSAPATYREAHERALRAAYRAGQTGASLDDAMVIEAMGQHFLTDSFASGHITTQRGGIADQFQRLYPNFAAQFKTRLVEDLTEALNEQATGLSDMIPSSKIRPEVRKMLEEQLAGKPLPTLGDLVSLVVHDYDNEQGIKTTNDHGEKHDSHGDGGIKAKGLSTQDSSARMAPLVRAVGAGADDLRRAYELGTRDRGAARSDAMLFAAIRASDPSGISGAPDHYAPERLVPRPDPAANLAPIEWQAGSIDELWDRPIRAGMIKDEKDENATYPSFGALLIKACMDNKGEIQSKLNGIRNDLPEKIDPFAKGWARLVKSGLVGLVAHGHLWPRKAFEKVVIGPLTDGEMVQGYLNRILST